MRKIALISESTVFRYRCDSGRFRCDSGAIFSWQVFALVPGQEFGHDLQVAFTQLVYT